MRRGEEKQKSAPSSRPISVERAFFFLQAKADDFLDIKYIAKRKVEFQSILTFLKDHSQASPSPVGFIFAPFSLFFVVKWRKSLVICGICIILLFYFIFHTQMHVISHAWNQTSFMLTMKEDFVRCLPPRPMAVLMKIGPKAPLKIWNQHTSFACDREVWN